MIEIEILLEYMNFADSPNDNFATLSLKCNYQLFADRRS